MLTPEAKEELAGFLAETKMRVCRGCGEIVARTCSKCERVGLAVLGTLSCLLAIPFILVMGVIVLLGGAGVWILLRALFL